MKNIYDFFFPIYQKFGIEVICKELYIHKGTVNRWIEKKEVPSQYYFDLCRLEDIPVLYSNFTDKEKDQFFTHPDTAEYCYQQTLKILGDLGVDLREYTFIEPSAGDGSFFDVLPIYQRIGVDIEPRCDGVDKQDFLRWKPDTEKNICIGNPPFGLRGHLALKFINHAAKFSNFVCFILPQLFDSNGKGSCKSRVQDMNLIHSEIVNSEFHYPRGKDVSVNVVFQIWSKDYKIEEDKVNLVDIVKLYSLSDGGTPGSTRNKKHLYTCDYYLPSTCFGTNAMQLYTHFEDLPHRRGYGIELLKDKVVIGDIIKMIDWSSASFSSTNGAENLRFDIIEKTIWRALPDTYRQHKGCLETPLLSSFI
jgi:hypothetical protein